MANHGGLAWRTSSRSSNGEKCVEVAPTVDGAVIRHSKHPDAGTIAFSGVGWSAFLRAVSGDLAGAHGGAAIARVGTDMVVRSVDSGVELRFDEAEWSAFVGGVADGEFDFGVSADPSVSRV